MNQEKELKIELSEAEYKLIVEIAETTTRIRNSLCTQGVWTRNNTLAFAIGAGLALIGEELKEIQGAQLGERNEHTTH